MNISIIGSGNVGIALGNGWHKAGHSVVFGVRDPQSEKAKKAGDNIPADSIQAAITKSDVVVIATPSEAIHDLIPFFNTAAQKVVIDTTNAFRVKPEGYPTAYHALKALTPIVHLVKCFNTTGFENMANPIYQLNQPCVQSVPLDMFMAGDSLNAKTTCRELARDLGFERCYDFGGGDKVELLEQFALSWINLAIMQGYGRNIAFKLISRQ